MPDVNTEQEEPIVVPAEAENNPDSLPEPQADPKDMMIEALTLERDGLKDQLLRTMAEAQNVQRRIRAQADLDRKFSAEPLAKDLIQVLDNFERTIRAAEKGASADALLEGVRAIDRQLRKILEGHAVSRIGAEGAAFDPVQHEALISTETDEHPEDHVLEVIESGYMLHDRVIRPARVRVAKKP